MSGHGGPPPDDHERRCQSNSRHTHEQCRRWALKGSRFCQFHGGRGGKVRKTGLAGFYSSQCRPTLKKLLDDLTGLPHHKQMQLNEELALARVTALNAVKLADAAFESGDRKSMALAIPLLQDALMFVKDMCLAVSKIEAMMEDKVSLTVVDLYVTQIVRVISKHVTEEVAERIATDIRENVKVPVDGAMQMEGVLSPSALAAEMDELSAPPEETQDGPDDSTS